MNSLTYIRMNENKQKLQIISSYVHSIPRYQGKMFIKVKASTVKQLSIQRVHTSGKLSNN